MEQLEYCQQFAGYADYDDLPDKIIYERESWKYSRCSIIPLPRSYDTQPPLSPARVSLLERGMHQTKKNMGCQVFQHPMLQTYLDLRYELLKGKATPFVYGDWGYNFDLSKDQNDEYQNTEYQGGTMWAS